MRCSSTTDVPSDRSYYRCRRTMAGPIGITHLLVDRKRQERLLRWQPRPDGQFRQSGQDVLGVNPEVTFTVGPPDMHSAVLDLFDDDVIGEFDIDRLAADPQLRERLDLRSMPKRAPSHNWWPWSPARRAASSSWVPSGVEADSRTPRLSLACARTKR